MYCDFRLGCASMSLGVHQRQGKKISRVAYRTPLLQTRVEEGKSWGSVCRQSNLSEPPNSLSVSTVLFLEHATQIPNLGFVFIAHVQRVFELHSTWSECNVWGLHTEMKGERNFTLHRLSALQRFDTRQHDATLFFSFIVISQISIFFFLL